jgi:hypothetical protein
VQLVLDLVICELSSTKDHSGRDGRNLDVLWNQLPSLPQPKQSFHSELVDQNLQIIGGQVDIRSSRVELGFAMSRGYKKSALQMQLFEWCNKFKHLTFSKTNASGSAPQGTSRGHCCTSIPH